MGFRSSPPKTPPNSSQGNDMFIMKNIGIFRQWRRISSKNIDKVLKEAWRKEDGKMSTLEVRVSIYLFLSMILKVKRLSFSHVLTWSSLCAFELWKVCHFTSSMPNLLKFKLPSVGNKTFCFFIDGGLNRNNLPKNLLVMSVGNDWKICLFCR